MKFPVLTYSNCPKILYVFRCELTVYFYSLFQTAEFFLFAVLMFVDTIVFMIMSVFYKYKPNSIHIGDYMEMENDTTSLVDREDKEEIPLQAKEKEQ